MQQSTPSHRYVHLSHEIEDVFHCLEALDDFTLRLLVKFVVAEDDEGKLAYGAVYT